MARGSRQGDAGSAGGALRIDAGLDLATLLGLMAAGGVIAVAVWSGGAPRAFLDMPSMMIVFGGTLGVTMMSHALGDFGSLRHALPAVLIRRVRNPKAAARQMLLLAEAAHDTGTDTLAALLPDLRSEPFLYRSVALIANGLPPDDIERVLTAEINASTAHHVHTISILRRAADVAPAMGLIGTLVGLVQMLGELQRPEAIGPAMAIALLTTFYGAVLANLLLTPLADKVSVHAETVALYQTLYLIGAVSIARQENPRRLEMLLNTALPPASRIQYFSK